MPHLIAEGGYQSFVLHGTEKVWLVIALAAALFGIVVGLILMRGVLAADTGTVKMREIAAAIQEGAEAFLRRQFRAIAFVIVPLAVLIFFTATKVTHVVNGTPWWPSPSARPGSSGSSASWAGRCCSGTTGFIGMSLAVRGNVRTAAAARGGQLPGTLKVAFRTGAVTGMLCVGLGLLGATVIVFLFQNTATAVLVGFGFGASLIALFMRVGGGIFTKAADVGADLVGKVEAGIPEDDPRNAATIADNVGDNVGDCAGMAADLFESYVITIVAAIILGYAAFTSLGGSLGRNSARAVIFPLIVPAIGIVTSAIGVYVVRARPSDKSAMAPINRGFWTAAALTVLGAGLVAGFYLHYMKAFYAVLTGVVLALVASLITEHFTSTERRPGPRDRRGGPDRPGHHRPGRHLHRARVDRLGHPGHRRRHRRLGPAGPRQRRALALPDLPHRHRHAVDGRDGGVRGLLRTGLRQRRRGGRDVGRVHRRGRTGHGLASTPWATPPRPSPRAWPSARP